MKLKINNAVIEVTRRCNMNCCHCLRGEQQNFDNSIENINKFFKIVDEIETITFSGGEPSLNVSLLNQILDSAEKNNVEIRNFYIATNGKLVSDQFLLFLTRLYCFCKDNEFSQLKISSDLYHEEIPDENRKKLAIFSFLATENQELENKTVLWMGKAKENFSLWDTKKVIKIRKPYFDFCENEDSFEISEPDIYLSSKGEIVFHCDLSFDLMDNSNFKFKLKTWEKKEDLIFAIKQFYLSQEKAKGRK